MSQAGFCKARCKSNVASPPGAAQIQNPYGPPPASDVAPLETPEGYAVLAAQNGSTYDIFIDLPGTTYAKYIKNGSPPSDYTTSNRNVSSFLANKQETYDGRAAINPDTDFDGVSNAAEAACGLNPNLNDTDGDGISDGREYMDCRDTDGDGHKDANDTDSDGDGIPDNLEDKNLNGRWDAGETDATFNDTDRDGLLDGTEDANRNGIRDAPGGVYNETSPIDKDTDDDGIDDKKEVDGTWCYVGESVSACGGADHNARKTSALNPDSDGDGLQDGQEIGRTSAGVDTLVSVFKGDSDPSSTTNPKVADTDADGLSDRLEDANLNGRVDSGEPNPSVWDTDGDKLPDGWVNVSTTPGVDGWTGEDKNLNGSRNLDADGNYTETDFLANDSDVDGIADGAETNGTWSYKSGVAGCPGEDKTACKLDPLNPDFDGDGLRDGQETAGWMVGVWRESTMEKVTNYTVNSDPTDPTSDGDALTDFEEFMNGSDPRALDTDKDGINDTAEIERKSNITGVEGSPPRIENVMLNVGITWAMWGPLYLPSRATVTVSFDVTDNVGIAYVDVKFTRYTGSESRRIAFSTDPANYTWSYHVAQVFEFSILEALVAGAEVNVTAYDVNGNGAWGEFHVKSVVEAVVEAIAAMFSAIAKVIVEAASAAVSFLIGIFGAAMEAVFRPLLDMIVDFVSELSAWLEMLWTVATDPTVTISDAEADSWSRAIGVVIFGHPLMELLSLILTIATAVSLIVSIIAGPIGFIMSMISGAIVSMVIGAIVGSGRPSDGSLATPSALGLLAGFVMEFVTGKLAGMMRAFDCVKIPTAILKIIVGLWSIVLASTVLPRLLQSATDLEANMKHHVHGKKRVDLENRFVNKVNKLNRLGQTVINSRWGILLSGIGLALQVIGSFGIFWPLTPLAGAVASIIGFGIWVYSNIINPPSFATRANWIWIAIQVALSAISLGFAFVSINDVAKGQPPTGIQCWA